MVSTDTRLASLKRKLEAIKAFKRCGESSTPIQSEYHLPSLSLLNDYVITASNSRIDIRVLEDKLSEFNLKGEVINVRKGPVLSRYEIKLARGVRLAEVRNVSEDLALALMTQNIRIQAPIPGTDLVGIEVPNSIPSTIGLKNVLSSWNGTTMKLPIALGVDAIGNPKTVDLTKMPHLLIAGTTGSGKSVCLNNIVLSILYSKAPTECRLVLVDPKRVEFSMYKNVPHLWRDVVTDPANAVTVFDSLIEEMENRYKLLSDVGVRNIESYNTDNRLMPYIVAVVDEMADLMMCSGKELENKIVRLAQLARAVGIHLVLATQKPIVKVITGLIKSNISSRIAFQTASMTDSRVILDCNGAEKLIGKGDMLALLPGNTEPERLQGAWVSDAEIKAVVESIKMR
jgi:S-DNA-T family DNA segregation ATPase FtsK/SpoIIIE